MGGQSFQCRFCGKGSLQSVANRDHERAAHPFEFERAKMEFGRYYVVAVAFDADNVIHRAIVTNVRDDDSATLFCAGYEPAALENVNLRALPYFRVYQPIRAMDGRPDGAMVTPSLSRREDA